MPPFYRVSASAMARAAVFSVLPRYTPYCTTKSKANQGNAGIWQNFFKKCAPSFEKDGAAGYAPYLRRMRSSFLKKGFSKKKRNRKFEKAYSAVCGRAARKAERYRLGVRLSLYHSTVQRSMTAEKATPEKTPNSRRRTLLFRSAPERSPAKSPTSPHASIWKGVQGPCPK